MLAAVPPLLLAMAIYVRYRPEATQVNLLLASLLPAGLWHDLRAGGPPLAGFVVDSLPGGLWVFAATLMSRGVRLRSVRMELVPVMVAVFLELLQWMRVTDGTFDVLDVAAEVAGGLLAALWLARQRGLANSLPALCALSYAILPLGDLRR